MARVARGGGDDGLPVYGVFEELRQGSAFSQTQKGQSRATIVWPDDGDSEAIVTPRIDIKKSLAVAAEKVGLPKLTRHMMRHTFATFLGSKGATDMDLMDLGGWKSVAMVRRYRKVVDDRPDQVHNLTCRHRLGNGIEHLHLGDAPVDLKKNAHILGFELIPKAVAAH